MRQADAAPGAVDVLSRPVQELMQIGSGVAYTRLVVREPAESEGVAEAEAALQTLTGLTPEQLVTRPLKSREDAQAMLAGLWLWHDRLEPAHRIAQELGSPTGSFWHAIMHRREGDFENSRYWYARCAEHPSMQVLAVQAASIIHPMPADKSLLRLVWNGWDAAAWTELVQQVHDQPQDPRHAVAVRLQQLEWRILFDHCTRQAVT